MQRVLSILFVLAILAVAAPAAFADEAPAPASNQTATVAPAQTANPSSTNVALPADLVAKPTIDPKALDALQLDAVFSSSSMEAVCHPSGCPAVPCPYQYPRCVYAGCCG